jgi:nucleoside-diphosphate-sugar epimerase
LVHVDDVADLYCRVVEQRAGGVYHATDGSALTLREIVDAVAAVAPRKSTIETWSVEEARRSIGGFADGLAIDQIVASTASEQRLGWRPRFRSFARSRQEMYDEWIRG